jgi:hypothetical protein
MEQRTMTEGSMRESPIGSEPVDRSRRPVELLDAPILEDARLGMLLVLAEPDMRVFVGVALASHSISRCSTAGKNGLRRGSPAHDRAGRRAVRAAE